MNTSIQILVLSGFVALASTIVIWAYWALAFPILKRQAFFRAENCLDKLRMLALENKVCPTGRIYAHLREFLTQAKRAAENEDWIMVAMVPQDEVRDRTIRLNALLREMDEECAELRNLVGQTMETLLSLYFAQRPFLVCVVTPIFVLSLYLQRAKNLLSKKRVEYAASLLAEA